VHGQRGTGPPLSAFRPVIGSASVLTHPPAADDTGPPSPCEVVFRLLRYCNVDDEGYYSALVRMFEQALMKQCWPAPASAQRRCPTSTENNVPQPAALLTVPGEVIKPSLTANSISYIFFRCRKGRGHCGPLFEAPPKLRCSCWPSHRSRPP
jgi:hypothetical protein